MFIARGLPGKHNAGSESLNLNKSKILFAEIFFQLTFSLTILINLGSGKSTLAKSIAKLYENTVICAGDDYFIDPEGKYVFDPDKLADAHKSAQLKAENACK